MQSFVAGVLMAGISIPVSFLLARGCLRAFVRIVNGRGGRNVL